MKTIKLQDTSGIIGTGSRLENYWKKNGFENFYTKFRKGLKLPKQYQTITSVDNLIKTYKLNAVGFGNWVTQEDRFNYICALNIAMYDINKVLGYGNNIGFNGLLSLSFGARGTGSAIAHFESSTFIINITRYSSNTDYSKEQRFVMTGGVGSLAHEYGHALDYYFGMFREKSPFCYSLSGDRSLTRRQFNTTPGKMRQAMDQLLEAIIWKKPNTELSSYYQRLEYNFGGDYMFRRNEIFARAFEKYVQYKLHKMGIYNSFLNETKYTERAYLKDGELERVLPHFERLMQLTRQSL